MTQSLYAHMNKGNFKKGAGKVRLASSYSVLPVLRAEVTDFILLLLEVRW
jgi:hypothetical protein